MLLLVELSVLKLDGKAYCVSIAHGHTDGKKKVMHAHYLQKYLFFILPQPIFILHNLAEGAIQISHGNK